jgi:Helix-turn-helix domain
MTDHRKIAPAWPPTDVLRRAVQVDAVGKIPFVDTAAAARYLALSPHSLECYRSLGGGPPFYKFGKFVRYAVSDLESWAAERRHVTTPGTNARTY